MPARGRCATPRCLPGTGGQDSRSEASGGSRLRSTGRPGPRAGIRRRLACDLLVRRAAFCAAPVVAAGIRCGRRGVRRPPELGGRVNPALPPGAAHAPRVSAAIGRTSRGIGAVNGRRSQVSGAVNYAPTHRSRRHDRHVALWSPKHLPRQPGVTWPGGCDKQVHPVGDAVAPPRIMAAALRPPQGSARRLAAPRP